jgi:biotin synthase
MMEPPMVVDYQDFATKALRDETLTRSECQAVLDTPDEQLLGLLQAAFTVRARYFGKTVRLPGRLSLLFTICDLHCPHRAL